MIALNIIFMEFEYNSTPTTRTPTLEEFHSVVSNEQLSTGIDGLIIALVMFIAMYLLTICICWYIEYKRLIPQLPLFKWITFGIGNAKTLNIKKFLLITVSIYVALIMIITGLFQKIIIELSTWILSILNLLFQ